MRQYTAQVGLIPGVHSIGDWLIQTFTHSTVHHVVIALNEHECIGAEPGGAKIRPIKDFPTAIWSSFGLTKDEKIHITTWARKREGVAYNWWCDLAIGLSFAFRTKVPRWLENYLSSDYVYECAQLAQAAYTQAGIDLFPGTLPGQCYPGSFIPIFKANGWIHDDKPRQVQP
jgi:uncharacterized protein YycO